MRLPPGRLNGSGPLDAWLNQLRDYVVQGRPISSPLVRMSEGPKGMTAYPMAVGGGVAAPGTMVGTLTAIFDNYLVLTDVVTQQTIRVVKQYKMRNNIVWEMTLDGTPWNFTYQTAGSLAYVARTKTNGNNNTYFEYQRVTPVYSVANAPNPVPADQITYAALPPAYAAAINITTIGADTGATVGTLVTNIELGPSRIWMRKVDQTQP